jgi:hypothetical protein
MLWQPGLANKGRKLMSPEAAAHVAESPYAVRLMQPDDAPGVVACLRAIYGDSYVHPELYDPAEIVRQNTTQELVSAVAVDATGKVVGHYALERPGGRNIAEGGVALVLPEARRHQLMERMRELLEQEALRLNLIGVFGHAVTNHTFTQHVDERFHEEPCAVSLAWSPRTFHNMPEPLPQRMTELLYFKYLRRPAQIAVHLPKHHTDICQQIYAELDVMVVAGDNTPVPSQGQHAVTARPDLARAVVQVQQVGHNSADTLAQLTAQLLIQNMEALFVELPLSQSGTPALCEAAEQLGYSFSGIGPAFAPCGDVLRLHQITTPLDPALILVESQHARELLAYVVNEQTRVSGS